MTEIISKETAVHAIYTVVLKVKGAPPTRPYEWSKQIFDPFRVRISYDSDMDGPRAHVSGPRILKGGKHGAGIRAEYYGIHPAQSNTPEWVRELATAHAPDWSTILHGS